MPLDKKVKLASFQENMLSHKTVFLSLCRSLWEDKLLYTLVPAARLFSRAACLAISHGTGVSKSCSRRVSFWDWGEYDDFSKVVGLVAAFGARVEIIFAHILVFPACAIEVQHINENSPTIYLSTVFSTFDMDKSGKIRWNHWKKPLKNNKITKLESDLLKTLKIHSSLKSQNFTDACTVGHKLAPHVIQQTSLNFRNFPELYLCSIKTHHVAMKDFP